MSFNAIERTATHLASGSLAGSARPKFKIPSRVDTCNEASATSLLVDESLHSRAAVDFSVAAPAPVGSRTTSQGHPRTIFKRAVDRANLFLAEATAREMGRLSLADALELTALVANKEPRRNSRFAARWLAIYLDEREATIEEVSLIASCLVALTGPPWLDLGRGQKRTAIRPSVKTRV